MGCSESPPIISRRRVFKASLLVGACCIIITYSYIGLKSSKPTYGSYTSHQSRIASEHGHPSTNEVKHIAFLKVHKAGSSTVQNILYRFGLARNLTFVLPKKGHYLSSGKYEYWPVLPLSNSSTSRPDKYDILCNHAVFNLDKFREFVYEDAAYVAIVREPLSLFVSAANYYRYVYPVQYIANLTEDTFITELIQNYTEHEPENATYTKTFNLMARDFGFVLGSPGDVEYVAEDRFNAFIDDIKNVFKLVLVLERFDESLVLMKRRLGWTLKDILYLKQNVFDANAYNLTSDHTASRSKSQLTPADVAVFNRSHWMDIRIYETFLKQFEEQIAAERKFQDELYAFKMLLRDVQGFCAQMVMNHVSFERSYWSESFMVTTSECGLMKMDEITFYEGLLVRHKEMFHVE